MASSHAASLVNITGFIAGTTLYAMLLAMVLRPRSTSQDTRAGIDSLLVLTAVLGLVWNIEAFVSNGLRDFGVPPLPRLTQALAFASLGLESEMHTSLGVGLRNIEERLERVYGDAGTLNLTSSAGTGTLAELRVPFTSFTVRSFYPLGVPVEVLGASLHVPDGWRVETAAAPAAQLGSARGGRGAEAARHTAQFRVTVASDAAPTEPYWLIQPRCDPTIPSR